MKKTLDWAMALRAGWEAMKRNLGMFIILLVSMIIVTIAVERVSHLICGFFFLGIRRLPVFLVQVAISAVAVWVSLRVHDRQPLAWDQVFSSSHRLLTFLVVYILYGLMIALGLFFLVVPGVLVALLFSFAPYVALDEGLGPIEALRRSMQLTRGALYDLFLLWLVLIGVNLLGLIAAGVGLFATVPTSMVAVAWAYRELQRQTVAAPLPPEPAVQA